MARVSYADDLRRLAKQLDRLADAEPSKVMTELGDLIDNSSETALLARLRAVRRQAAHLAVDAAGGKAPLARSLGVSETAVYRALGEERRVRRAPKTQP